MNFLLDTSVISEWVKREPDRNVVTGLAEAYEDRVFVSVISFAEVRRGIELMVGAAARTPGAVASRRVAAAIRRPHLGR